MSSMIYEKKRGGVLKVHDRNVVDNILIDGEREKTHLELKKSQHRPKKSDTRVSSVGLPESTLPSSVDSKGLINQTVRVKDWLNEKTIKELQERADHESHAAKKLYSPLLETEATFVKDVGDFLTHKELVDLRKKEILHKRWSDQVYEPIRKNILEAIDGSEWCHLDRRKREMHRQFLEHVNKRGFVFLDDDDTEEYYAQALNGHRPAPIKIKTKVLSDPLLALGRQRNEEDRIVLRCITGQRYSDQDLNQIRLPSLPLVPLGRHGINSCKWLEMPLTNIESEARERSRCRMLGIGTKSQIDFPGWAKAGYDAKVAEELQIPCKRMFEEQPPYGKTPVEILHGPFIDAQDFSDKIVNTNPFPEHMSKLKEEYMNMQVLQDYHQQQMNMLDYQNELAQQDQQHVQAVAQQHVQAEPPSGQLPAIEQPLVTETVQV